MLKYFPVQTNIIDNKPAFLYVEENISCPDCYEISKWSFLHAVLYEKKNKLKYANIQYFCFECKSVITVEKEVFIMKEKKNIYAFGNMDSNENEQEEIGREPKAKLADMSLDEIIASWEAELDKQDKAR